MTMEIPIIALCLGLLIWLAYRGMSVLVLAPVLALLAAALSGMPVLASFTQIFMVRTGDFIVSYYPLFLLGAIFGKLMEISGAAHTIGEWTVSKLGASHAGLAIILSCAILTYGGISLFVVAFAVYPLAAAVFRKADIPARLIPGSIALGAFTFTMTALPGTPSIQNAIPMPYFGTNAFAAPGLGLVAGAIMLGTGYAWLHWRTRSARTAREDYAASLDTSHAMAGRVAPPTSKSARIPLFLALLPIVTVVAVNLLMVEVILPRMDLSYLQKSEWGAVTPSDVTGIWSIMTALTAACLTIPAIAPRRIADLMQALSSGAESALKPIFNTAALVGFGAVIAATPGFGAVRHAILDIAPGNPLISLAIAVNVLAGITGSA